MLQIAVFWVKRQKIRFFYRCLIAGVCPTQLTLILTGGANRSSQMSSLKRGLGFARAHRVPHLGKPFVNGRWNTSSSVESVGVSPHKVPAGLCSRNPSSQYNKEM